MKKNHTEWLEQIEQIRARDIRTIEKTELRELPQDAVERNLPKEARLQALLEKIENPYCYLDNGMIVKLNFAPRGAERWLTALAAVLAVLVDRSTFDKLRKMYP